MILKASILIFVAYITAIFSCTKCPRSISHSFYTFNKLKKGLGNIFTFWMIFLMFLLAVQVLDASQGKWFQFIGFFAVASLGFIGVAPYFKTHERTVHSIAAICAAFFGVLWIALMGYWFIPFIMLLVVFVIIKTSKHHFIFWGEMALFVSIFIVLKIVS